jgi:predicted ATPase
MRMTKLTISNYGALRDVSIPLSHFGCLIGENNSGKSSLRDLINPLKLRTFAPSAQTAM